MFSTGYPLKPEEVCPGKVSQTDCRDVTEILLKPILNPGQKATGHGDRVTGAPPGIMACCRISD